MDIPGLHRIPSGVVPTDCDDISLATFSLQSFSVPGAHIYGNCRPITEFEKINIIGEGNFSTVYKGKDKNSGQIVCLKRLKISREPDELMPQNHLREIANLKLLNHENIANLLTVAVDKSVESTYLVLDYCEYSLAKVIDRVEPRYLGHKQIKHVMTKLFTGLDFIHRHGVFHRDLTPMNIMFTTDGVLKIIDFGLSRKMTSGSMTPKLGLRWYKAPEILFGATKYTPAVDIWASGCIFAEMIRLKVLFPGSCDSEVIKRVVDFLGTPTETLWPGYSSLPIPKSYTLRLQPYNRIRTTFESENNITIAVLHKTLAYNPSSRPSAEQCLGLAYFQDYPLACSLEELLRTLHASVMF